MPGRRKTRRAGSGSMGYANIHNPLLPSLPEREYKEERKKYNSKHCGRHFIGEEENICNGELSP
jgi:hypothetical protein